MTAPKVIIASPHAHGHGKQTPRQVMFDLANGAFAGAVARTVTAPLERVKVILQTQVLATKDGSHGTKAAVPKYNGIFDALKRIPREEKEGIFALWRGNWSNVLRIIPTAALRFAFFDRIKVLPYIKSEHPELDSYGVKLARRTAAGGLAGGLALFVTYPLDLVRVRMTADLNADKMYRGVVDCMRQTVKNEGPAALFKGMTVSMVEIVPYMGLTFGIYDSLNDHFPHKGKNLFETYSLKIAMGVVSGGIASVTVYPLDTVRRRLMLTGSRGFKGRTYRGIFHCISDIARTEGITAFYNGCWTNFLKAAPAQGIQLACYDIIKELLTPYLERAGSE